MAMDNCFKIDNNKMYIQYEPINDLDEFASTCMKMLAAANEKEVYIIMDESVNSIASSYVGVLMSCAMLSNQMGRKLHIKCNSTLKRLIDILDGHKLMKFID
ncbi:MAG: hypothetical protein GF411_08650 [Candidatus Lokiarchaeota archaeon]|nr:hypothetical protein [Candidatus Lokiarchaeota archaeon]